MEKEDGKIIYNSSSPDEVALINFAKQEGKDLLGEEKRMIRVAERAESGSRNSTKVVEYEKLAVLEFNSERKRMSVIIRDPMTKRIELLTKGADSTIEPLLRDGQADLAPTKAHVDRLSVLGLRTLFLGKKTLTEDEYQRWFRELQEARSTIGDDKKARVSACY